MKAHEFDAKFEADEDITEDLDLTQIKKPMLKQKRVNVDFPAWMLESLDRETHRISPLLKSGLQKGWKLYRSIILAADCHFRRAGARPVPTIYPQI